MAQKMNSNRLVRQIMIAADQTEGWVYWKWKQGAPKTSVEEFMDWVRDQARICEQKKIERRREYVKRRPKKTPTDKDRERSRDYYRDNIFSERMRCREKMRAHRSTPNGKMEHQLRGRLLRVCRNAKVGKTAGTMALLGCEISQFVSYIAMQFTRGMTWENFGMVWHLDHIRPIASFSLTDPEHQRQCFHYTNLRPLPALKNLQKGSRRTGEAHQVPLLICV